MQHINKHLSEITDNDQHVCAFCSLLWHLLWVNEYGTCLQTAKRRKKIILYPSSSCLGICRDEAHAGLGYIWIGKAGNFLAERLSAALWYLPQVSYCLSSQSVTSLFYQSVEKASWWVWHIPIFNLHSCLLRRALTSQLPEMGQLLC